MHGASRVTISVIVCAYNEARYLPACLHSLLAQTRPPDEILVVDNASSDGTGAVARAIPGVRVVREPDKGLVISRETARRETTGDILAYVDADCRAPLQWLERIEARFARHAALVAVTGPYRFYDWDWLGRALIRAYDLVVAPPTHVLVHDLIGAGAILHGGNYEPFLLCDFHVHTSWSDGRLSVREVVDLYGQTGRFDVIGITDHILMKRDMLKRAGRIASLGLKHFSVTEERFAGYLADIEAEAERAMAEYIHSIGCGGCVSWPVFGSGSNSQR